jgi:hypothetical protein
LINQVTEFVEKKKVTTALTIHCGRKTRVKSKYFVYLQTRQFSVCIIWANPFFFFFSAVAINPNQKINKTDTMI